MHEPPALTGRRGGGPARWLLLALVLAGFVAAFFLDASVYEALSAKTDEAKRELEASNDWYRLFRIQGFFPTWLFVAFALFGVDSATRRPHTQPLRRGTLLIATTAVAGLATEILKLIFRRARPSAEAIGGFFTRGEGVLDTSNLAFPSSHAAVAFAAAFSLSFLHPRAAPVLLLLASCCGLTRIAAGAHHFSDIYGAMLLSYATARLLYAWDVRNNAAPYH